MFSITAASLILSASVAKAAFLIDGPPTLVQCEPAQYNWTGSFAFPVNLNFGENEDRQLQRSTLTNWTVDYPAGSVVNVRIDSASAGSPNIAYAGSQIVQPSSDASCIPAANQNAVIPTDPLSWTAVPPILRGCNTVTWSWTGGQAPYTVYFYALNSAGLHEQQTTSSQSIDWQIDFPAGSTIYANVQPSNLVTGSNQITSKTFYIFDGFTRDCVNPANVNASFSDGPPLIPAKPVTVENVAPSSTALFTGQRDSVESGLGAGAIAGIVIGALALVLIWLAYMFLRRRQARRQAMAGAHRLNDDNDNDASDDGKDSVEAKGKGRAGGGPETSIQMSAMPSVGAGAGARQGPPPMMGQQQQPSVMGQLRGQHAPGSRVPM